MIKQAKFPNLNNPLLSGFHNVKDEYVQFHSEGYSEFLKNAYGNAEGSKEDENPWMDFFGASNNDQLCANFLSTNLSTQFANWESQQFLNKYLPGENIPFQGTEYYTEFSNDIKGTVLNLNADFGKVSDTSPGNENIQIELQGIDIVEDPVFGKVMHFSNSNTEESYIKIDDNEDPIGKLRFQMSKDLPSDTFLAFVLAKVNHTIRTNNGDSGEINYMPFFKRFNKDDLGNSQYQFTFDDRSNPSMRSCSSLDFGHWNSDDRHQQKIFPMKNFKNEWTLYAIELTHSKDLNDLSNVKTYLRQFHAINPPISAYLMTDYGMLNVAGLSNNTTANFPTDLTKRFKFNNYENVQIMRASGKEDDFIKRMTLGSSQIDIATLANDPFEKFINGLTGYDGSSLYIGLDKLLDGTIVNFKDSYVKYVKIIKVDPSYDFNYLASREYYLNCFLPKLRRMQKFTFDDSNITPEDNRLVEDNSINGKYIQFLENEGNLEVNVDIPPALNHPSYTIAMWLSCSNIRLLNDPFKFDEAKINGTILPFGLNISQYESQNYNTFSINLNNGSSSSNSLLYSIIGNLYDVMWSSTGNYTTLAKDRFHRNWTTVQTELRMYPFTPSNDARWHHLAITYQYFDSGSKQTHIAIYLDGRSITKNPDAKPYDDYYYTETKLQTSGPLSLGNHMILHSNTTKAFNLKSIEIYTGETDQGEFLQEQDIYNLYLKDYAKYFYGLPSENKFTFVQSYLDPNGLPQPSSVTTVASLFNEICNRQEIKKYTFDNFSTENLYSFMWSNKVLGMADARRLYYFKFDDPNGNHTHLNNLPSIYNGYSVPYNYRFGLVEFYGGSITLAANSTYAIHFLLDDYIYMKFTPADGDSSKNCHFIRYISSNPSGIDSGTELSMFGRSTVYYNYQTWITSNTSTMVGEFRNGLVKLTTPNVTGTITYEISGHFDFSQGDGSGNDSPTYLSPSIYKLSSSDTYPTSISQSDYRTNSGCSTFRNIHPFIPLSAGLSVL